MSDTGRKDLSTQASEALKPDSQKSAFEKASETVTDAGDKIAASVQPGDSKSTTQKLSDTTRSGANDAQNQGQGVLAQVQETATQAYNAVSEGAANLLSSVTGSGNTGTTGSSTTTK